MRRPPRAREAGFSLLELMLALTLFSFSVVGILSIAVTMVTGFRDQRLTIGTESSSRVSLEFVADAIRGASPAVPTGDITDLGSCAVGAFEVIPGSNAPDELVVVYPSGSVVTSLRDTYPASAVTVVDGSQLAVGDTILITNTTKGHLVRITAVAGNVLTLATANGGCTASIPAGGYGPGSLVLRVARVRFFIEADWSSEGLNIPHLMMDPTPDDGNKANAEPLAEGIEDLQVALGIDENVDGYVAESPSTTPAANDDEWLYNATGSETLPPVPTIPNTKLRAVRIWMVARATKGIAGTTYRRPAIANRTQGPIDTYRRRTLTSTVEVRNLGGSP